MGITANMDYEAESIIAPRDVVVNAAEVIKDNTPAPTVDYIPPAAIEERAPQPLGYNSVPPLLARPAEVPLEADPTYANPVKPELSTGTVASGSPYGKLIVAGALGVMAFMFFKGK